MVFAFPLKMNFSENLKFTAFPPMGENLPVGLRFDGFGVRIAIGKGRVRKNDFCMEKSFHWKTFLVENDFDFAAASLKRFENLGYKIKKNEDSI